ncbi:MAG: hypothetical protein Q9176_006493 [Flavoplaca citrina]
MHRDFEGVGGWRIPNTEGEDILWTSMNARLELPAFTDGHFRHHRRAVTSVGVSATARTPTPFQHQGKTPPMARPLDMMNQEEYFQPESTLSATIPKLAVPKLAVPNMYPIG